MRVIDELVRPNIKALKAYSSARDEFEGDGEIFLDANENPFETGLNRYPDPYQRVLKRKISELKQVEVENIFLGNGSDEAIDLIFRIFCEPGLDNIIITDPTYGMYEVSAGIHNVSVTKVPLNDQFELNSASILAEVNKNTKLIFLCTPNNPSGNQLDPIEIGKLLESFNGIVVIDEAYIDFSRTESWTFKLSAFPNLIVLQTFSKAWGLAGLRLGMAFASDSILGYFNKVKAPYNLNILTQKEALKALDNASIKNENVKLILSERDRLSKELSKLKSVEKIYHSECNFLLVRFKNHEFLFKELMNQQIIVRNRSKALHCSNCLRLTIGTPEENNLLLQSLTDLEQ